MRVIDGRNEKNGPIHDLLARKACFPAVGYGDMNLAFHTACHNLL